MRGNHHQRQSTNDDDGDGKVGNRDGKRGREATLQKLD